MLHEPGHARRSSGLYQGPDLAELGLIQRDGDFSCRHTNYHTTGASLPDRARILRLRHRRAAVRRFRRKNQKIFGPNEPWCVPIPLSKTGVFPLDWREEREGAMSSDGSDQAWRDPAALPQQPVEALLAAMTFEEEVAGIGTARHDAPLGT